MVRKALSLIFVLLLSINSFAAVVSDNDGSAFITKAEFDSLKNDFQSQINKYNTSIDSKIDDAIASYLAGVTVGAESNKEFKYKSWKKVTQMNYKPTETWRVPSIDFSMAMNEYLGNSSGWQETSYAAATVKYDRPEANKQKILMCDAGEEYNNASGPEYITWVGRSINYKDKIIVTLSGINTSGYYQGVSNSVVRVYYWARIGTGYYSNLNTYAASIWNPCFYYYNSSTGSYSREMSTNWTSQNASASVELEIDSEGNQYDYSHIISWGSLEDWSLCDKTWTKHLCKNAGSMSTTSYSGTGFNTSGNYAIMEAGTQWEGSTQRVVGSPTFYKGQGTQNYNVNTPTVGLIDRKYNVNTIYQINEKFKERVDDIEIESKAKPVLPDGLPMFAAKKGDKITWTPIFTKSTKGTTTDLKDKIALYLSVGPMDSTYNLKDTSSKRIKDKDNNEYFVIKDNSEKITFEMPADGIVYAKWRHEPIYSGNWEITLDVENCGIYKREKGVK